MPIAQGNGIKFKLADMATEIQAARLITYEAAAKKDRGDRVDLEAMRIYGGYGYVKGLPIERYYRKAPLMITSLVLLGWPRRSSKRFVAVWDSGVLVKAKSVVRALPSNTLISTREITMARSHKPITNRGLRALARAKPPVDNNFIKGLSDSTF